MNVERTSVEGDRTLVLVSYILHLVGAVAGLTSIVGPDHQLREARSVTTTSSIAITPG